MKPIYLEFCGINSFSEKAEIDFRALLSGGVFGIFGDTGSGKSTILDCIHLALYGQIERSSGSECINYNADSAYVVFDFEITTEGKRHTYRVRRERRRKNNVAKAYLYEYGENNELLALAEGTRDVNAALERIIGLTFEDFKMCIALPQGDFAALVKAPTAERVKLVSRLFDLEKYGEKLAKAVNEKFYRAEEEVNLVKAKMEQNDGGRVESIAEKQSETEAKKQQLKDAEEIFKRAETEYEKALSLDKEKKAYDEICARLVELEARRPAMEEKRKEAERLPLARTVAEKAKAVADNEREKAEASKKFVLAESNRENAAATLEKAKETLASAGFDEHILQVSVKLDKVLGAAEDVKTAEKAKEALDKCIAEFNALRKACPWEDFDEKKGELENQLTALGEDESLLDYIKHHYKDLLQAETYGEFREDLRNLGEKYPETAEDIALLIGKYTFARTDEEKEFDVAEINLAFKKTEQRRKLLKEELQQLEKRKQQYDANEIRKNLLIEQGKIYRESYNAASEKIAFIKDMGTSNDLKTQLEALRKEKENATKAVEEAQAKVNAFFAEAEKQKGLVAVRAAMEESLSEALDGALAQSGFSSADEAGALIAKLGDENAVKADCKAFFDKYELYKNKCEETDGGKFKEYSENALIQARENKLLAAERKDELNRAIATAEAELKRLVELREKYRAFEKDLAEKEKKKKLCDELRTLLRSNRFLEYIASEYLQEICVAASKTLLSLTGGRYFLKYEKEFKVGDNLDGGELRAVKTLSGGETFLVSLSLALSLSGAICLKSLRPIEFFFLDEGFGTLDGKLVETVMDVLGKLSKSFAVGLISHVEELKHRIENKILVTGAAENHGSRVGIECF